MSIRSLCFALIVFYLSPSHALAGDGDLRGACDRAVSCYNDLSCRPTISKDAIGAIDAAKCYLDSKCGSSMDAAKTAQLDKIKAEFPANDSNSNFYERNVKAHETELKRLPSGY